MERSLSNKSKTGGNPYDINGQHFNPDMYLQKLFKEHSLKEAMEQEETIVRDTQTLHSEMQTLVYENYNKFISATDTIRKMKSDFKQMETEMDLLEKNMDSITLFSDQISNTLQDSRQQISKLSGIHILLKRLQFLFKLPNELKNLLEEGNYKQAVSDYVHKQQVLNHYAHLESVHGIQKECLEIENLLKEKLYSQFDSKTASAREVTDSVEMLLMLNEPADALYRKYLANASLRLKSHLEILENLGKEQDLVELVEQANNSFFNDLRLIVKSYKTMLSGNKSWVNNDQTELDDWIAEKMNCILTFIESRAFLENDTPILVTGLDRLYNTLSTTGSFSSYDFTRRVIKIGVECVKRECTRRKTSLSRQLTDSLIEARQSLSDVPNEVSELLQRLIVQTIGAVETHIAELQILKNGELSITCDRKLQDCTEGFLREILVVGFLEDMINLAQTFTSMTISLPALLVFAKMCHEFSNIHIHKLLNLVGGAVTSDEERLAKEMLAVARNLGNHYVKRQGNTIGQMIRKSIETRDSSPNIEPRHVRAVMKRVLEDLSTAEPIASLFEDGPIQPPGSGSRHHARSSTGVSWTYQGYTHRLHNKLFSDKIEIFTPIEFTKTSILTGIIKISLKTFFECVRLRTFNTYGYQQIQVDVHYLQLYLWKYIPDEISITTLLEQILESAAERCINPVPMEPSIVDIICEGEKKMEKNMISK